MKKILGDSINQLKLSKKVNEILIKNKIEKVVDLCNFTRMELVDLQLTSNQINEIIVSLQLEGLDLKRNHAKRNTSLNKKI